MPLVAFKPTKARLVIEDSRESVLVMKVVLAKGESVELASGGKLETITGVLRVRQRKADTAPSNDRGIGSLVFVDPSGADVGLQTAKFQINISMSAKKFNALTQVALAGRLPSKFFVDAGERVSRLETKGLSYRAGPQGRTKVWDNKSFRTMAVTNFLAILPISVPEPSDRSSGDAESSAIESTASYAQVAELADDLAVFHSQTQHILIAIVTLFAVMAVLALLYNVVQFLH